MIILAGKVRVEIMRLRFRAKKESCSAITAYIRITREQGKSMTDKIKTKESVHDQIMISHHLQRYKQNILRLAESERLIE